MHHHLHVCELSLAVTASHSALFLLFSLEGPVSNLRSGLLRKRGKSLMLLFFVMRCEFIQLLSFTSCIQDNYYELTD